MLATDGRSSGVKVKLPWSLVALPGWSFIQHRQSVSEKTVVKSGWSLIRVVVHEEFYCSKNYWYLTKANNLNKHTFNTSIHCTYP